MDEEKVTFEELACIEGTGLSTSATFAKRQLDSRITWNNCQRRLPLIVYRLTDKGTRTKHGQFWDGEDLYDLQAENFLSDFKEFLVEPMGVEPTTS